MSDISAVKALVFDVFGTVVDWRTSLIDGFHQMVGDARHQGRLDRAGRRLARASMRPRWMRCESIPSAAT